MGKKRKTSCIAEEHDVTDMKEDDIDKIIKTNSKSNKNGKKVKLENSTVTKNAEVTSSSKSQHLSLEENPNTNNEVKNKKGKKKVKKSSHDECNNKPVGAHENMTSAVPTKKRFVDDISEVVRGGSSQQSTKKNNSRNVQQNEEEEVNDEDIDKFCNELTEEDNVQFDNWVKLIEAKLHSKKNK